MSGIGLHLTFGRGGSGPPDLTPVAGYSAWLDPRYCFGWDTTTLYAGADDLTDAALQTAAYPNPVNRLAVDGCQGLACNRNQSQLPPLLGDLLIYPSWLSEADRLENANMLAAKFGL